MSDTKHTPEPWSVWTSNSHARISSDVTGKDGDVASAVIARDGVPVLASKEEDARRICAAINACAGIPTKALESGVVRELVEALREAADGPCDEDDVMHYSSCRACLAHEVLEKVGQ